MGFSNASDKEKKEKWIEAFRNVNYKKVLFYNGKEEMPEIFKAANERFVWEQTTAERVETFDYNDFLRLEYFCDLNLLKMLNDGMNYSRYG